jgi:hypothetical protein
MGFYGLMEGKGRKVRTRGGKERGRQQPVDTTGIPYLKPLKYKMK